MNKFPIARIPGEPGAVIPLRDLQGGVSPLAFLPYLAENNENHFRPILVWSSN